MTKQEILDYLNQYRNAGNHIHREAMDAAIEAFEKQIPKKPTQSDNLMLCSNCGSVLRNSKRMICIAYCDNCGQAIDWSDTE